MWGKGLIRPCKPSKLLLMLFPLPIEVPEPNTVAVCPEDKSFPGCCVSPFGRNPPLPPSCGKQLPLSLSRDLPGLGPCQDIRDAALGNVSGQQHLLQLPPLTWRAGSSLRSLPPFPICQSTTWSDPSLTPCPCGTDST